MPPINHVEEDSRSTGATQFIHGQQVRLWMNEMENRLKKHSENIIRSGRLYEQVRGYCRKDAASYIGVSFSKFDELVRDGRMPRPVKIDGRVIWDRVDLDEYFEMLKDQQHSDKSDDWFDDDRGEV